MRIRRLLRLLILIPVLPIGPSISLAGQVPVGPSFAEGFEDTNLKGRGWYDGDRFELSDDALAGKHSIRYQFDRAELTPSGSSGARHMIEPTEVVYLRFYLKLSPGWSWTDRPYGPHMLHFMTTENGKFHGPAASHLTLYVEPVNGRLRLATQDIQNKDSPHGLTQGPLKGGYNGRFFDSEDVLFDDDEWHLVEAMFKLNSLDRAENRPNPDGELRGWVDGKLVIERTDVVFRSTDFPGMKINQFLMLPYFHHGVPHDQALWIDELAVGTGRIGPVARRNQSRGKAAPAIDRPRLVVLTDISSLDAGEAEPDDGQSLIRLMLYADEFDIEGLIATSNLGHGQKTRPDLIRRVVDAYGKAHPNLILHDPRYPSADRLRDLVKAGQPVAGPKEPVERSVGEGKDTEASEWIIRVVDRPDPRPAWVLVWGGSADLAQALWKVRATRRPDEVARFVARLRVHSIGDQDSTGPWIREQFPDLYTITQRRAYRGMYRGGDTALSSSAWVKANIHGHGPLGDLYPDYDGGDIWSSTLGGVRGIKEGDTPSFLSLVPNGLSDTDRPSLGSWGGRFEGAGKRLTDVPDRDIATGGDPDPRMSSVYRWRTAFQADFESRLDWCVKPFAGANHPPAVRIRGEMSREVVPGEEIVLNAGGSTDPDGDGSKFEWSPYPIEAEVAGGLVIEAGDKSVARVRVGPGLSGRTIPILLSVSDRGRPSLTRYGRVLLKVKKAE